LIKLIGLIGLKAQGSRRKAQGQGKINISITINYIQSKW